MRGAFGPSILLACAALGCGGKKNEPTRDAYARYSVAMIGACAPTTEPDTRARRASAPARRGAASVVYAIVGSGQYMGRVLVCREVDTNYDGLRTWWARTISAASVSRRTRTRTTTVGSTRGACIPMAGLVVRAWTRTMTVRSMRCATIVKGASSGIHRDTDGDGKEESLSRCIGMASSNASASTWTVPGTWTNGMERKPTRRRRRSRRRWRRARGRNFGRRGASRGSYRKTCRARRWPCALTGRSGAGSAAPPSGDPRGHGFRRWQGAFSAPC